MLYLKTFASLPKTINKKILNFKNAELDNIIVPYDKPKPPKIFKRYNIKSKKNFVGEFKKNYLKTHAI